MSKLSRDVLAEIKMRGLRPRSLAYFLAMRSVFWLLAGASIVFGGLTAALGIFAVSDLSQTGGRGLDEMPFDDFALGIPLLCLVLFAFFTASAYLGFSRTPRGYRFRPLTVALAAAAASLALGVTLHVFHVGSATHAFLSAHIPSYKNYTDIPYDAWSQPERGQLGGTVFSVDGDTVLQLKAFDGRMWTVDIRDARNSVDESLLDEGDVAIRGHQTGPLTFKADFIDAFD